MFILNGKRINIDAPFKTSSGTTFPNLRDPSVRSAVGVVEISDPEAPADFSDKAYYRTEQDEPPFVIYTKKSAEQLEQIRKSEIQNKIDELERSAMMPRVTREYMLLQMEAMFTPEQLSQNYGYRKVKEFDNEISALRASL